MQIGIIIMFGVMFIIAFIILRAARKEASQLKKK